MESRRRSTMNRLPSNKTPQPESRRLRRAQRAESRLIWQPGVPAPTPSSLRSRCSGQRAYGSCGVPFIFVSYRTCAYISFRTVAYRPEGRPHFQSPLAHSRSRYFLFICTYTTAPPAIISLISIRNTNLAFLSSPDRPGSRTLSLRSWLLIQTFTTAPKTSGHVFRPRFNRLQILASRI